MENELVDHSNKVDDVFTEYSSALNASENTLEQKPQRELNFLVRNASIFAIIGAVFTIIPSIGFFIDLIAIILGSIYLKNQANSKQAKFAIILGTISLLASVGFFIGIIFMANL